MYIPLSLLSGINRMKNMDQRLHFQAHNFLGFGSLIFLRQQSTKTIRLLWTDQIFIARNTIVVQL